MYLDLAKKTLQLIDIKSFNMTVTKSKIYACTLVDVKINVLGDQFVYRIFAIIFFSYYSYSETFYILTVPAYCNLAVPA